MTCHLNKVDLEFIELDGWVLIRKSRVLNDDEVMMEKCCYIHVYHGYYFVKNICFVVLIVLFQLALTTLYFYEFIVCTLDSCAVHLIWIQTSKSEKADKNS